MDVKEQKKEQFEEKRILDELKNSGPCRMCATG